jgi:hypothetical protein
MVAIDQGIEVRKIPIIPVVQKDASRKGEGKVYGLVQVFYIVFSLYHRVINICVVYREPGADILVDLL